MVRPIGDLCAQKQKKYRQEKGESLFSRIFCRYFFSAMKSLLQLLLTHLLAFFVKFYSFIYKRDKLHSVTSSRGAVLIILACFLPLILLGIKYSEKLFQLKEHVITKSEDEKIVKFCAQEAALEVARNWNPGLTFGQQQDGVYKVADAVYNTHPCYYNSVLGRAVPGVVVHDENGDLISLDASAKQIKYTTSTLYFPLQYFEANDGTGNPYYLQWLVVDKAAAPANRTSKFDSISNFDLIQHEICLEPHDYHSYNDYPTNYPNDTCYYGASTSYTPSTYSRVCYNLPSTAAGSFGIYGASNISSSHLSKSSGNISEYNKTASTYTSRVANSTVEISVSGDKIKVRTDDQEGYAVPAQCNVDIVLAVPVNGAACNADNRDASSDTSGTPYTYTTMQYVFPLGAKNTPIYQMGQALKAFVKDNFYHTRGVNMSLIPYSGKVSIPLERATAWTVPFPAFVDTSTDTQLMIGSCLYGTSGVKDATLTQAYKTTALGSNLTLPTKDTSYYWGSALTGCPIMFRAGVQQTEAKYGGNSYFRGFLANYDSSGTALSAANTDPSKGNSYKYLRMNLNPCYMGYANLLSMKCEQQCTHFLPNPYYMIEPTADLVKIYEMCNALFPINDPHNVSNFIFIPLEWAYNMFQSWTNDPEQAAISGTDASATLSRPSKTTGGRKKAVILLVNKPDWFEQEELTYLGFSNDFSEIPMVEGDCIRFDINYSDTSKKFADGTSYDGTIRGAKKILKFTTQSGTVSRNTSTGYYECSSGTGRLSFPKKYLIKVVVEPVNSITWEQKSCNLNSFSFDWYNMGRVGIGPINDEQNRLLAHDKSGGMAYSADGITWSWLGNGGSAGWYLGSVYGNGIWVDIYRDSSSAGVRYSTDSAGTWKTASNSGFYNECSLAFGNGVFMTMKENSSRTSSDVYTSSNGSSWTKVGTLPWFARLLAYRNGKWIAGCTSIYQSTDNGKTWTLCDSSLGNIYGGTATGNEEWYGADYYHGYFYAINYKSNKVARSKDGKNWELVTTFSCSNKHRNVTVYNDKLYIFSDLGTCCHIGTFNGNGGSIQFSGISSLSNGTTTSQYGLTERKEFFIEPTQITTGNDGNYYVNFEMQNIRLISAEITNRPYTRVTPTVSRSGSTFTLNAKVPFVVPVTVSSSNAKITYTNTSGTSLIESFSRSRAWQIDPDEVLYVKSFNSGGIPSYKVTVTTSNVSLGTPVIGTVEEKSGSVSGLTLDSDNGSSGSFTVDGDTFSYTKTKLSDTTGTATVSGGKITCPIGAVLHVRAVPASVSTSANASVTFYNNNNIEDNVGTYTITGSKTFTFSGAQVQVRNSFTNGTLSSLGKNFAHNLSKYKVRYSLSNAKITAATLSGQVLRHYACHFNRGLDGKVLITNDGKHGVQLSGTSYGKYVYCYQGYSSSPNQPADKILLTSDSCMTMSGSEVWSEFSGVGFSDINVNATFYLPGLVRPFYFWAYGGTGSSAYIGDKKKYIGNRTNSLEKFTVDSSVSTSNSQLLVYGSYNQFYFQNLSSISLLNTTIDTSGSQDSNIAQNKGIALQRLSSQLSTQILAGDYICFQGDGELKVTVEPTITIPTIKFNCMNEDKTTHELFKEGNFCIEPSQMTDNGNGTQSVTYTTSGSVTVSATYEITNQTKLTISKPSNITFANFDITGHKKEMKWTAATKHPNSVSSGWSWTQRHKGVEYDGTTCYIAGQQRIAASNDLGKTWYDVCAIASMNSSEVNFVYAAGDWYLINTNGQIARSYTSGSNWEIFSPAMTSQHYIWGGFTYANKRYVCVNCFGYIFVSDDGTNWTQKIRANSISGVTTAYDGWNNGNIFVNGTWIVSSDGVNHSDKKFKLIESEDQGNNWKCIIASSEDPWNDLVNKDSFFKYGSNEIMITCNDGHVRTSLDTSFSKLTVHKSILSALGFKNYMSLGYANGTFLICSSDGKVGYTTFHDGVMWRGNDMVRVSRDIDSSTIVNINTEEHSGVNSSNMTITGISATYAKLIPLSPTTTIEYTKISLPDNARYVDFSTNTYKTHESSVHSSVPSYWKYNEERGCYVNTSSDGHYLYQYFNNIPGDYFSLAELTGQCTFRTINYNHGIWEGDRWAFIYPISGLYRNHIAFSNNGYGKDQNGKKVYNNQMLNDYRDLAVGTANLMLIGLTLPVNAALYHRENGNISTYDSTELVKSVTQAACSKLKSDYGENVRIYLIKYRKQDKYKHPVTGTVTSFDYGYLDSCATLTGGTSYTITSEASLKTTLDTIAKNIKEWAEYEEAKNVAE